MKALDALRKWLDHLTGALMLALVTIIFINVILRYVFSISYPSMSEIIGYLTVWMVFISTATLCSKNDHISMGFLKDVFPQGAKRVLDIIIAITGILIAAKVVQIGFKDTWRIFQASQTSPSGAFPLFLSYLSVPVGFLLVMLFYGVHLVSKLREKGPGQERSG